MIEEMNKVKHKTLEQKTSECQDSGANQAIIGSDGIKYCFMSINDITQGTICPYQGEIAFTKDSHIRIRCTYTTPFSKSSKMAEEYSIIPMGC